MILYKHYSFDLWMTLIRSNPMFKQERAKHFHDRFNGKNKSIEEVFATFRQVDLMCNSINEHTGRNIDAEEMYLMVIHMLNDGDITLHDIDVAVLYHDMDELLFTHIPVVYDGDTIPTLESAKNIDGVTTNILSNTGFIKGRSLRKVLNTIDLSQYFDFQLYSDEEEMSKPSSSFFQLMVKEAKKQRNDLSLGDILHIGDNPNADIKGANSAGIAGMLVNSNNISIAKLVSHVTENILTA